LSVNGSNERPLNECSANTQQIKENKIKENKNKDKDKEEEEETEKWRKWNETQIQKQMQTDKLEELAIAGKDNQIEI
jgi:hypothetical protein